MTADQLLNRVLPGVDTATPVASGAFPVIQTGIGDRQLEELGSIISSDKAIVSIGGRPFEDSVPEMARVGGKIDSPRTFDSDWEFNHSLNSVYSKESFLGIVPFEFRHGLTGVVDGEWLRLMKRYGQYWNEIWRGRLRTRQFDFIVNQLSSVINDIDSEKTEIESLGYVRVIPWRYDRLWKTQECDHLVIVGMGVRNRIDATPWTMKGKYIREYSSEKEGSDKRFKVIEYNGVFDKMTDMAVALEKRLTSEEFGVEFLSMMSSSMRHEIVTRRLDMNRLVKDEF